MPDPRPETPDEAAKRARRIREMLASGSATAPVNEQVGQLFSNVDVGRARMEPEIDVQIGDAQIEPTSPVLAGIGEAAARETDPARERRDAERRRQEAVRHARAREELRQYRNRENAYDRDTWEGVSGDVMGFSNQAEAFQAGGAQGITLSLADELYGLANAHSPRMYREARDRYRAEDDRRREASPGWYTGGRVVGGIAPALALPGSTAATLPGRVLQSAGMGAGMGAVEGFGSSRGELDVQLSDTLAGAGYGGLGGAAGQLVGEAAQGVSQARARRGVEPRTNYSEAEQATIASNPRMRDTNYARQEAVRHAAIRRVMASAPGASEAAIQRAGETYPGGITALARDLDIEGIARSGSIPSGRAVQQRAQYAIEDAMRPRPAPVPEPQMPPGARAGQFNDDVTVGPERTVANPPSRPIAGVRVSDDIPADPHDRFLYDPNDTLEVQARRVLDPESTGRAPMSAEDIARSQEATAPRAGRRGRPTPQPAAEEPIVFSEGMGPPPTPPGARPLPEHLRQAAPEPVPADEPIGFGMDDMYPATEPPLSEANAARRRTNIRAAERREMRGGYSRAAQDDRTWPVDIGDVEDITPPPAQPPPLPVRAQPAPPQPAAPQRPQVDLGAWEAPPVEVPGTPSPAATTVRQLGLDAEFRRGRPIESIRDGAMRLLVRPWAAGRGDAFLATLGERRARQLAQDVALQLRQAGDTRAAARLLIAQRRGPQVLSRALLDYTQSGPEAQATLARSIADVAPEEVPEVDEDLFTGGGSDVGDVPEIDPDLF